MASHFTHSLNRLIGWHYRLTRASKPQQLSAFLEKLRPVASHLPLRRFGPPGDGGYLMPDDVENIGACISPGVDVECGFDLEMANRGIPVFLADASVTAPPAEHPQFHFRPKFLGVTDDHDTVRLSTMVSEAKTEQDLILQMDIEGAEYLVLLETAQEVFDRVRIMVIEFHALDDLFARPVFPFLDEVFRKLCVNHDIVHIHPNNCKPIVSNMGFDIPPVMEFTFYRRDRNTAGSAMSPLQFPHPLDADNVPDLEHMILPDCWRRF